MQTAKKTVQTLTFKGLPIDPYEIAMDLSEGCLTEIKELYFIEGKYAPIVRWCAFAQDDWPEDLKALFGFWRDNFNTDLSADEIIKTPELSAVRSALYTVVPSSAEQDFSVNYVGADAVRTEFREGESFFDRVSEKQSVEDLFKFTVFHACAVRAQALLAMTQGTDKSGFPLISTELIAPFFNADNQIVCCVSITAKIP